MHGVEIGKRVREGEAYQWQEIIGVVADVRDDGVSKEPPKSIYWPIVRNDFGNQGTPQRALNVAVRSSRAGSESLIKDLQQAVWSVDANLPLARVRTAAYFMNRSMARTSFTLLMLAMAGGMALLLGSVGVYGVIAYSVSQRRREIGIRIALGAQPGQLMRMFVRYGLVLTAIGAACGFAVSVTLSSVLSSLLFERESHGSVDVCRGFHRPAGDGDAGELFAFAPRRASGSYRSAKIRIKIDAPLVAGSAAEKSIAGSGSGVFRRRQDRFFAIVALRKSRLANFVNQRAITDRQLLRGLAAIPVVGLQHF